MMNCITAEHRAASGAPPALHVQLQIKLLHLVAPLWQVNSGELGVNAEATQSCQIGQLLRQIGEPACTAHGVLLMK